MRLPNHYVQQMRRLAEAPPPDLSWSIVGPGVTEIEKLLLSFCYELLFRGSSFKSLYSSPKGPIAITWVTYSPDFAQW